jgi:lysophospholipid acyltransferase (LPLAT)-like uncharacterized protein
VKLRSWDRFQIPLPFSRCEVILGKPLFISRDAAEDERERTRAKLEAELRRLNPD